MAAPVARCGRPGAPVTRHAGGLESGPVLLLARPHPGGRGTHHGPGHPAADRTTGHDAGADGRNADQRYADAVIDLLCGTTSCGTSTSDSMGGGYAEVRVTLSLDTLTGRCGEPGELAGYGPLHAAVAADLAKTLSAHASTQTTCRFPGCRRTGQRCEIDHIIPFDGTNTTAANLQCLCPRHHHLKHEASWQVTRGPDGITRWTTHTGRRYDKPPDAMPLSHDLPP